VRSIASTCLEKPVQDLRQGKLSDLLKHVVLTQEITKEVEERTSYKVKCHAGSHYELREKYTNVKRKKKLVKEDKVAVAKNKTITSLEKDIESYRRQKGKKIGQHDSSLIRQYANLGYIAPENPEKQLDIKPPEKKAKDGSAKES
jgi:hypothetical protein